MPVLPTPMATRGAKVSVLLPVPVAVDGSAGVLAGPLPFTKPVLAGMLTASPVLPSTQVLATAKSTFLALVNVHCSWSPEPTPVKVTLRLGRSVVSAGMVALVNTVPVPRLVQLRLLSMKLACAASVKVKSVVSRAARPSTSVLTVAAPAAVTTAFKSPARVLMLLPPNEEVAVNLKGSAAVLSPPTVFLTSTTLGFLTLLNVQVTSAPGTVVKLALPMLSPTAKPGTAL